MDGGKCSYPKARIQSFDKVFSPFQVEQLTRTCCATTMFYFVCMDRRRPHVDHRECLRSSSCQVHNLSSKSFAYRHVLPNCQCDGIGIDEHKMMDILEEGSIPLVSCRSSAGGSISLSLVAARTDTRYTAVSHVSPFVFWRTFKVICRKLH